MTKPTIILDHDHVQRKLQRIAHQLYEQNYEEKAIVLVGVSPRGTTVATRLGKLLSEISPLKTEYVELKLDKDVPLEKPVHLSVDHSQLKDRVVILIDDVLMSGRTLMHAASFLIKVPLKKLTTVVLVDRLHRTYPIRADIVGLTLSTTVQEHISVELGKKDVVYLK
ncbi:MAG: phosphoribosyltransferase [Flavobacteriales bacterium]|nr:phosphoribosyltransferase [Flavobacteriales bacterium]MBK6943117.1 phosphoribosyltransferase [Flavobacteriales bacterium]MBK7242187.1 phosphoribosyltransferase [Flavobacteriales bacterium]MBK7298900.1 phosphoribosyltransferase [Flavobacteriales bacterium]MBK9534579.1 phosphoribosyltransferase [Flavobacteriales bacterium]